MTLDPGVWVALCDIVGTTHVRMGGSGQGDASVGPDAVVYPATAAEVAQVMRGAAACDLSVRTADKSVLRGRSRGEIVLDLCRMNRVLSIDRCALAMRVQPEVSVERLTKWVEEAGFSAPHLPRHAPLRAGHHLLAAEAVSLSGWIFRAVRTQHIAGFDMVDLLTSSTEALCVVTELTLALIPRNAPRSKYR